MTAGSINKMEAARRQLNCAIRLLLKGEDSLTVHNAAYDAYSLLRDLFGRRGVKDLLRKLENALKLREEPEYLKHAVDDPDALLHDHSHKSTYLLLALAVQLWKEQGQEPTAEMLAFAKLPNPFKPSHRADAALKFAQQGLLSDTDAARAEVQRIATLPSTRGTVITGRRKGG